MFRQTAAAGEVIIRQGDAGETFYIIDTVGDIIYIIDESSNQQCLFYIPAYFQQLFLYFDCHILSCLQ